jgi:hypothetical protein
MLVKARNAERVTGSLQTEQEAMVEVKAWQALARMEGGQRFIDPPRPTASQQFLVWRRVMPDPDNDHSTWLSEIVMLTGCLSSAPA